MFQKAQHSKRTLSCKSVMGTTPPSDAPPADPSAASAKDLSNRVACRQKSYHLGEAGDDTTPFSAATIAIPLNRLLDPADAGV